jgi:hypothetical protein
MRRVDDLSFPELVQELAAFEHDAEPADPRGDVERALRRREIDQRLMALLSSAGPVDERRAAVRVPGEIAVKLRGEGRPSDALIYATIIDLGEGGLRVRLREPPPDGARLWVELAVPEPPPQVSARVAWLRPVEGGVESGLQFVGQPDAHRRRLRRLVIELLRQMS